MVTYPFPVDRQFFDVSSGLVQDGRLRVASHRYSGGDAEKVEKYFSCLRKSGSSLPVCTLGSCLLMVRLTCSSRVYTNPLWCIFATCPLIDSRLIVKPRIPPIFF